MTIPTEPIGSIPRPIESIRAAAKRDGKDPLGESASYGASESLGSSR